MSALRSSSPFFPLPRHALPALRRVAASLALAGLAVAPEAGALDLPILAPGEAFTGPAYQGDRLEIRLRAGEAYLARLARRAAHAPERDAAPGAIRFGVASLDRLCDEAGVVAVEPEFRGESPPPPGSAAIDFTAFYVARLAPGASLERALERLRAAREVLSADPIAVVPVSRTPNDSLWSASPWFYQASRRDVHAPEAWDVSLGDSSVIVAVLDTGVLPYHPDLGGAVAGGWGNIWTNPAELGGGANADDDGNGFPDDRYGWDFVARPSSFRIPPGEDWRDEDGDPNDYAGHGTAVAGLVGALTDNGIGVAGTAWNVRLMPLRIGWSETSALLGVVDMSYVAQAIRYATRMRASVINCSFATLDQAGLFAAARAAVDTGIVIVAASGNSGQPHELAAREDVIAVASSDSDDRISAFSNLGDYVDLVAPGDEMISTFVAVPRAAGDSIAARQPGYAMALDGTSFAAPIVAGAVALLQARQKSLGLPPYTPRDALLRLRETADDIAALNPGVTGYGSGRLNLFRALTDPPSSTSRRIGALTVGAAAVVPRDGARPLTVFGTDSGHLLYLEGRGDTVRVVTLPGTPLTDVAAADLPGGRTGFFVGISGGRVAGYDLFGAPLAGWPVSLGNAAFTPSTPSLGDLDGDGAVEVVCGSSSGRLWAWRLDGTPFFPGTVQLLATVVGSVAIADFDGVPGPELVATTDNGMLHALRPNGSPLPDWPVDVGTPVSAPVIARLGSDTVAVVLVGGAVSLLAIQADLTTRFSSPLTSPPGGAVVSEPAVGDLDGDGVQEIAVATTGFTTLAVFDSLGVLLAGWPRALNEEPLGAPLIGRLHEGGDAARDLGLMLESGWHAFDRTASILPSHPRSGGAGRAASLADVDPDGRVDVVAGTGPDSMLYFYSGGGAPGQGLPWPTPRGNYARTGSTFGAPALGGGGAPGRVTDLAVESAAGDQASLRWTATADDGPSGRPLRYLVGVREEPLDEATFFDGRVDSLAATVAPGGDERFQVLGLVPGRRYWIAVQARDDDGNLSGLSNSVEVVTFPLGFPPGPSLASRTQPSRLPVDLFWRALGPEPSNVIQILDVLGRRVRTIDAGAGEGGVEQWNGRDDRGEIVPAGVYLARLFSGSFHAHARVVLLP